MSVGPADEEIDILVSLRDELSRPARKVERAIDDLRRQAEETSPVVDDLAESIEEAGDEADKASNKIDELARANKKNADETKKARNETERNTKSVRASHVIAKAFANTITSKYRAATNVLRKFRGENDSIVNSFKRTRMEGQKVIGWFGDYFMAIRLLRGAFKSDLFLFLPQLVTGLFSLGAAAVASLGPIGSLAGNLGLLAPGIALLLQMKSVGKMAFEGVGQLATLLSDPNADSKAIAEAMKDLGPNARKFAVQLAVIRRELRPIRKEVQETVLDGLAPVLKTIGEKYIPVIQRGLRGTATSMNQAFRYAGDVFGRTENVAAVDRVMARSASNTLIAGKALTQFLRLLINLTDAAGPAFTRVLTAMGDRLEWMADKADDGGLSRFFDRSATTAFSFMQIVRDLSVGLYRLARAATPLSSKLGKGMKELMSNFREFTGSEAGQQRIQQFFTAMIPNVRSIAHLFGSISRALVHLSESDYFSQLIDELSNHGIPALLRFFETLESTVTPAVLKMAGALNGIEDYPNLFRPLADVLTIAAGALKVLVGIWNMLPGPMQDTIAYAAGLAAMGFPLMSAFTMWIVGAKALGLVLGTTTKMLAGTRVAAILASTALKTFLGVAAIVAGLKMFGDMVIDAQAAKVKIDDVANALKRVGGMGPATTQKGLVDTASIGYVPGLGPKTNQEAIQSYGNLGAIANKGFWAGFSRVVSLGTYSRAFDKQTQTFDKSLAQLVKTGNMAEAKSSFDQLMQAVKAGGGDVNEVSMRFTAYRKALAQAAPLTQAVAQRQWEMANGVRDANGELLTQNQRLQYNIDKMTQSNGSVLALRDAQRQYQDTLKAANDAVKQNGQNLDITTEKGRANQAALDSIATSGLSVIASMQQQNATQEQLTSTMQTTRDNFIGVATAMGMSSDEAKTLADRLNLIPQNVTANVNIVASGIDVTLNKLNGVMRSIQSINGTTVTTYFQTKGAANGLGAQTVAKGLVARYSGGSVLTGKDYMVNERGPEAFVGNSGKVSMLGNGKMTDMRFSEPGYVVPNRVTEGRSDSGVPERVLTALRRAQDAQHPTGGAQVPQPRNRGAEASTDGPRTLTVNVRVNGNVYGEVDIERAARAGARKAQREAARRRNR